MLPKTVIIGATGFIGKFFLAEHRKVHPDCIGTSGEAGRDDVLFLDLSSPRVASLKLAGSGYRDALILAGIAKVAECEREKQRTRKVNVDGILSLVGQLVAAGIKPIFFSSDAVFDGAMGSYGEEDLPNPVNEYGRQKAEVEAGMKAICTDGNYLIIRISKIFSLGKGDGSLFDEMAATLRDERIVRAAYDQVFSPFFVLDLVRIVTILQVKGVTSVININPPEAWSRYDLALALAKRMGVSSGQVEKISLADLHEDFKRPRNTTMKTEKMLRETGYRFGPTEHYIERVAENWRKEEAFSRNGRLLEGGANAK